MLTNKLEAGALFVTIFLLSMVFAPTVNAMSADSEIQTKTVGPFYGIEMPDELKSNVIQVDPYTFVFKEKVDDKEAFVSAWNEYETKAKEENSGITPAYVTREDSGSDSATKDILGSYIKGETYFHGSRTDYVTSQKFIGDGNTKGFWYGKNPYNADKITLKSKVKASGVTVSISVPSGAGFSTSGGTATYSGTWTNAWSVSHYYDNLKATGLSIIDEDQNDAETFRFGTTDNTLYTDVDLDA